MKKIFLLFFLGGLFLPLIILAAGGSYTIINDSPPPSYWTITYEGITPCGRCADVNPQAKAGIVGECGEKIGGNPAPVGADVDRKFIHCAPCHLFVMIDGIIDFVLLKIVPPVATLILIIGGIALYFGGASPEKFNQARSILLSAIIGLVIIYTSWIIVNSTLNAVGIADWVGFGEGWFQISCDITTSGW